MGIFDSLFGSKQKSKSSFEPYAEVKPFLLGDDKIGTKGIFDEAGRLYGQGGFNPQMQQVQNDYLSQLANRNTSIPGAQQPFVDPGVRDWLRTAAGDLGQGAYNVANGAFDSNFGPVANIGQRDVSLQQARQSQGPLDPTRSLQGLLSGNVTNPYLQQQADAMTANLTRNFNENIAPNLRSEAIGAGQMGGSRQGIAEGLAASRLNQDLAPALTNLFGGAFENAQQRMYGTATGLNDQAVANATNNANRQTSVDQFNANLGLQNNNQLMAKNQANLGNRMQALDIAQGGLGLLQGEQGLRANEIGLQQGLQGLQQGAQGLQQGQQTMQDNIFQQQMAALGMPQDFNWNNLGNYQNVIYPGAQLGGTSRGTNTAAPGIVPAALGTMSMLGGIYRGLQGPQQGGVR